MPLVYGRYYIRIFQDSDSLPYTIEFLSNLSATRERVLRALSYNKGDKDLPDLRKGGILALSEHTDLSNRQIAKSQRYSEKTVQNLRRAASQAEKENRDPINLLIHKKKPRPGQPYILNDRDTRRMIRYITKNKANRRKPWIQIAREYNYSASPVLINNYFYLYSYRRYLPRYKPPLSPEIKK